MLAGVLGAVGLAAFADRIGGWAGGIGQDLVNVAILSLALAMLAWHCIWVSTHGREMARDARQLGSSVRDGGNAPWAWTVAIAMAVLREGAETVLFVAGLSIGSPPPTPACWSPLSAASGRGVALGVLIYFGLSGVKPQQLFAVTNAMILLLAAAIASQWRGPCRRPGWSSCGASPLWDSSSLLATDSPPVCCSMRWSATTPGRRACSWPSISAPCC